MARAFTAHVMVRETVQLFVNQRSQICEGQLVTIAPGNEELRYLLGDCVRMRDLAVDIQVTTTKLPYSQFPQRRNRMPLAVSHLIPAFMSRTSEAWKTSLESPGPGAFALASRPSS